SAASAARPINRRKRGVSFSTAITAAAISTMPTTASSQVGSACHSITALPAMIRLARNATNGVAAPISASSATSTPRRSTGRLFCAGREVSARAIKNRGGLLGPPRLAQLLQEAVGLQPIGGDRLGVLAAHLDAPVERLQGAEVELGEHRRQEVLDLRVLGQHRLADDRRGLVDRLHALVVGQH